jgi:hypothetical protein
MATYRNNISGTPLLAAEGGKYIRGRGGNMAMTYYSFNPIPGSKYEVKNE